MEIAISVRYAGKVYQNELARAAGPGTGGRPGSLMVVHSLVTSSKHNGGIDIRVIQDGNLAG